MTEEKVRYAICKDDHCCFGFFRKFDPECEMCEACRECEEETDD